VARLSCEIRIFCFGQPCGEDLVTKEAVFYLSDCYTAWVHVSHARCVVWTGDERVFFYNPSQNVSVWDCPEELEDRAHVKKLVQTPPRLMQQAAAATVAGNL